MKNLVCIPLSLTTSRKHHTLLHGSSYQSVPVYWPAMVWYVPSYIESYQAYRHIAHEGVPMYHPYWSSIGPVHITHTKRYVVVWRTLLGYQIGESTSSFRRLTTSKTFKALKRQQSNLITWKFFHSFSLMFYLVELNFNSVKLLFLIWPFDLDTQILSVGWYFL